MAIQQNIQQAIKNFYALTNTSFLYYQTGVLIDRFNILNDIQSISGYLQRLNFSELCIFPLIIENQLSGFFIINASTIPVSSQKLYRETLLTTIQHFLCNVEVQILDLIFIDEVSKFLNYLSVLDFNRELAQPTAPQPASTNDATEEQELNINIHNALEYIEKNITKNLSLDSVSKNIYLSSSYLSRMFKKNLNINFIDYVNTRKISIAQEKLLTTSISITELSQSLGFSQPSYFTKLFENRTNFSPSGFKKAHRDIKAVYTVPRTASWQDDWTVFTASRKHFANQGISFKSQDINGFPYVYSIDGLSSNGKYGWIYTVDCITPIITPADFTLYKKSVIQWIYTKVQN